MGRDKARLRLGSRTLLGHVRARARQLGLPLRIIRRDLVARCGPLGGIYTALKTSQADAELFLACDMPFVSAELLEPLLASWKRDRRPAFVVTRGRAGFPFVFPVQALGVVERLISKKQFSLQTLAIAVAARRIRPKTGRERELTNVNTPADWLAARARKL